MSNLDVIRAWKDEEYRLSLSEAEYALLPAHPAGPLELTNAHVKTSVGGTFIESLGNVEGPAYHPNTADFMCRTTKGGSDVP
jgi:mersacidin/lichenicidin family type 2 lantibiotic